MEILTNTVTLEYIRNLSQNWYGEMIKAVADVEDSQIREQIVSIVNKYISR